MHKLIIMAMASALLVSCASKIKVGRLYTNKKGDTILIRYADYITHSGSKLHSTKVHYIWNAHKLKPVDTVQKGGRP